MQYTRRINMPSDTFLVYEMSKAVNIAGGGLC